MVSADGRWQAWESIDRSGGEDNEKKALGDEPSDGRQAVTSPVVLRYQPAARLSREAKVGRLAVRRYVIVLLD